MRNATNKKQFSIPFVMTSPTIKNSINSKKGLLLCLFVCLFTCGFSQTYTAVPVSGFNYDIIANGTGNATALTNNDLGSSRALVSADYKAVAGNAVPTYALPATGTIASSATSGLTFQLAGYSANNALRFDTQGQSGTLTFSTPVATTDIYLLATAGEYDATITVQVNFTDASSQTFTGVIIKDWYDATTANRATAGIGRINVSNNALEGDATNPHIYQLPLAVDAANYSKQISSLLITKTDATALVYPAVGGGIAAILAVAVKTSNNCSAPTSQPTSLLLTPTQTSIAGSFTATTADKYLVLRTAGSSTPTVVPVNGTTYTAGGILGNATIVSASSAITFNDAGLTASTTYTYTVYAYNDVSCTSPAYKTTTPLTASITTSTPTNYITVPVSGFNYDIIANGTGNATALTNNDLGSSRALVAADYKAVAGNAAPTYALPATGTIASSATSGLTFQLAGYSANNALRFDTQGQSGTLTFSTPVATTDIYLLATAGEYDATITVQVNFTDASSQTFTGVIIKDWYDATTANRATAGIGRINVSNNALEGDATNPHIYQLPLAVDAANYSKQISSLLITKTDATALVYPAVGGGIAAILAVSLNTAGTLPITIKEFAGYKNGETNVVTWTTASEANNKGFEVQRSIDGISFTSLSFIETKAVNGYSDKPLHYQFTDVQPLAMNNYYRLKQIDKDGKASYSSIVLLKADRIGSSLIVGLYPNPVVSILNVMVASNQNAKGTLLIQDVNGKCVASQSYNLSIGKSTISFNVNSLAKGLYVLKMIGEDGSTNACKFIK